MRLAGLVLKEEPYTLSVPRSQRGGEIVEPMVSTQWFVRIQPLADAALAAVRDGRIRIVPERFTKVYYNWLENIQDWCISRQLWWGHRIPVWYCDDCGQMTVARQDPAALRPLRQHPHPAGPGCAGHLVLLRSVALLHPGLARGDPRPEVFLPHLDHGDRLRHPVLLGGAHDHVRAGVHRRDPLPHRLPARADPRRARAQDEQDPTAT